MRSGGKFMRTRWWMSGASWPRLKWDWHARLLSCAAGHRRAGRVDEARDAVAQARETREARGAQR